MFKVIIISFLLISSSYAAETETETETKVEFEVDLALGEEINELCAGCHGEFGEGGKGGEYPRLAGLPAAYIAQQIQLFKDEVRKNMPMRPYTNDRELPAEDVPSFSAYLSQVKLLTKIPDFDDNTSAYEKLLIAKKVFNIPKVAGDFELGEEMYIDDCQLCHGKHGKGKEDSDTPPLAGQYTEYMTRQIKDFADGTRWHEYGEELFSEMEADEVQAIMAYLSVMDD